MPKQNRRAFLQQIPALAGVFAFPVLPKLTPAPKPIRFGLLADAHADLIPDKMERLEAFVIEAKSKELDFILQLGDFCFPKKENKAFLNLWRQYKGPRYHVLGNHDMDLSSKAVIMDFWAMPQAYYSFDIGALHIIVLDANYLHVDGQYLDYDTANFYIDGSKRTFVDPAQLEWLKADLKATQKQCIIFSHQSLINAIHGIKNRVEIQLILEAENQRAGFQKVIACFNGHDHIDFHRQLNGIHYVEINSLSYQWLGQKYSNKTRYPAELYEQYSALDKIAPYKDPLYSFVEIDLEKGLVQIEGKQSQWLPPGPEALGVADQVPGNQYSPLIRDRQLHFTKP